MKVLDNYVIDDAAVKNRFLLVRDRHGVPLMQIENRAAPPVVTRASTGRSRHSARLALAMFAAFGGLR